MKLVIRGYGDGHLIFKERVESEEDPVSMAQQHCELLARFERSMIEIEFLNELDPQQRYLRFGTDSRGMVMPIKMKL